MNKLTRLSTLAVSAFMLLGIGSGLNHEVFETKAASNTVTYTVSSKDTLTTSGTQPTGSSAKLKETYTTSKQMTSGNSMTFTLSGYENMEITKITLSMHSNASKGSGNLTYSTDGGSTFTNIISTSTFNTSSWYGAWSTSFVNINKDVSITGASNDLVIKLTATANSLFCESITLTYFDSSVSLVSMYFDNDCDMSKKSYNTNDVWDYTGLIVKGVYDDSSEEDITNLVSFSSNPTSPNNSSITSVTVTASKTGITSINKTILGITIAEIESYKLISNLSLISAGDKVVISGTKNGETYVMSTTQNTNNRGQVSSTLNNGIIAPNSDFAEFTLGQETLNGSTVYTFKDINGYLYAASSSENILGSQEIIDDNARWTISLVNGTFTLTANGTNSRKYLKYNTTSSIFSCYSSGQSSVTLYYKSTSLGLSNYIMESNTDKQCETKFASAKEKFLGMTSSEQTLFKTMQTGEEETITNARQRYLAWATYLGENPYTTGSSLNANRLVNENSITIITILAITSISAIAIGGYLFYKKKKVSK